MATTEPISVFPSPDPELFPSPYPYARPELCLERGRWSVRHLVTCEPFLEFARGNPLFGQCEKDRSYQLVWTVIGNAATRSNVQLYIKPRQGGQKFYEAHKPGRSLANIAKGIDVQTFPEIRASIDDVKELIDSMSAYPSSTVRYGFNFIDAVAEDLAHPRVSRV